MRISSVSRDDILTGSAPDPQGGGDDPLGQFERRGIHHYREGRYADAVREFREVARLQPTSAGAFNNLASALGLAGQAEESVACYKRAIELDPANADAYRNLANVLGKLGRPLDAIETFRVAQKQFPDDAETHYSAGRLYYNQGLREEALAAFARVLGLSPRHARARWMSAVATLPQAYGIGEEPDRELARFEEELNTLDAWFDTPRSGLGKDAVGEGQAFYVAFHERDNKRLLSRYGDLCARLMQTATVATTSVHVAPQMPVRLALVSGHVCDQSVWTALVRGWCANINRDNIELHLFHTGTTRDAETELARRNCATFTMGAGGLTDWVDAIRAVEPAAILYPEIGMDSTCAKLASLRLAKAQLVAWGHPETSGLPTLDRYLSAEAFEPPQADARYRERLVRLPNLGSYYEPLSPEFVGTDWAGLGVNPQRPRLMCAGTPYKYMPRHDEVLIEIARHLTDCQFLFFVDPAPILSHRIHERLCAAFSHAGLDPARFLRLLPRQSRPAFFGMMRDCDALLDTIGFSGFNTAMQAIECELPIVAWEGQFMRGRLASGTLRLMGMDELVATDTEAYVATAVKLCSDLTYRLKVGERLAARSGILMRDEAPVRGLERAVAEAVFQ
jgi:protein O-GlcNAc transferase